MLLLSDGVRCAPPQQEGYGHQPGEGHFDDAYRSVLEPFWRAQKQEISQASTDLSEYKSQQLPLARIKKVCRHTVAAVA